MLLVLLTFIESKVVPRIGMFNSRIECPQCNTASAFVRAVKIRLEVYSVDTYRLQPVHFKMEQLILMVLACTLFAIFLKS